MDQLRSAIEEAGQGHVFDAWDALNNDEKKGLEADISDVDFLYVDKTFRASTAGEEGAVQFITGFQSPSLGPCMFVRSNYGIHMQLHHGMCLTHALFLNKSIIHTFQWLCKLQTRSLIGAMF